MQLKKVKFNGVFSDNLEGKADRCIVSVNGKTVDNLSDEEVENLLKEDGDCALFQVKRPREIRSCVVVNKQQRYAMLFYTGPHNVFYVENMNIKVKVLTPYFPLMIMLNANPRRQLHALVIFLNMSMYPSNKYSHLGFKRELIILYSFMLSHTL